MYSKSHLPQKNITNYFTKEGATRKMLVFSLYLVFVKKVDLSFASKRPMTNNSSNPSHLFPNFPRLPNDEIETIASSVFYIILALLIIGGNSLVIAAYRSNPRLQTVTNSFLVGLAVSGAGSQVTIQHRFTLKDTTPYHTLTPYNNAKHHITQRSTIPHRHAIHSQWSWQSGHTKRHNTLPHPHTLQQRKTSHYTTQHHTTPSRHTQSDYGNNGVEITAYFSSDLLVGLVSIPLWLYFSICQYYGPCTQNVGLKIFYPTVDVFCGSASVLQLTAISVERCIALTQPIRHRTHSPRFYHAMIVMAWLIAFILAGLYPFQASVSRALGYGSRVTGLGQASVSRDKGYKSRVTKLGQASVSRVTGYGSRVIGLG
ncbi:predicted protein [Nematostella vectensis]|uniref:G-protein coupled receptors family 1 profile domain-containing protein n=1 Tax=Nematostella vectensis TaxID=45351 RepID=A7RJ89_NEMVE|nr:predicted protein [Nematostella vectensis]|eukprot:XP_001640699.1 predicted protein [Nematostella vectensis]